MPEKEIYLVRLPCSQNHWFKLHLYKDGSAAADKTSHVELNQHYKSGQGTIFCNKAGDQDKFGGEMTPFQSGITQECEEDGLYAIIQ